MTALPLTLLVLLVGSFIYQIRVGRLEKYSQVGKYISLIGQDLRNLQTFLSTSRSRETYEHDKNLLEQTFKVQVERVLDHVVELYSTLIGTRCRAAIKLIEDPKDGKLYVYNFARYSRSAKRALNLTGKDSKTRRTSLIGTTIFGRYLKKRIHTSLRKI